MYFIMLNPLAQELNDILDNTVAGALLSDSGRRIFFPKGIIAQGAEAKAHASYANATIGIIAHGEIRKNIVDTSI